MNDNCWQQALVEAHPGLFVRWVSGVPFAPGFPACPQGWRDLVTQLVARVSAAGRGYPVQFVQMAEQHGVLRVHWRCYAALPRRVEFGIANAVALAEARSAVSCFDCGATGRLFSRGFRLVTVCNAHQRGIPVPAALHRFHTIRALDKGRSRLVCARYDRASDCFVEVQFVSRRSNGHNECN